MKSELGLGVLFTGKLDPSFDAVINRIKGTLGQLQGATQKVTAAQNQQRTGILSLQKGIQGYIKDVEALIKVQARWYGAKAILFAAVEMPISLVKQGLDFTVQVDTAEKRLRRYNVMLGEMGDTAKQADHDLIVLARQLNLNWGAPFDAIVMSADRLRAAGVELQVVMGGVLEEFTKFQTAWPEVEMDKFTKAVVGMVNTYRNMPGFKEMANDTERFRAVLDKLTVAMGIGVIEPRDLPQIMQHFGQMAQSIALSVDEMMALSVLVTNLGSKAGPAARALRGLSAGLVQEDKIKLLKQLGIEIDRNIPLGKQLLDIIGQLREKVTGSAEEGITAGASTILGKIVSVERVQPLIALIREYDKYFEILKQIQGAAGANVRTAEEMNKTLGNQWKMFVELVKEIGKMLFQSEELGRVLGLVKESVRVVGLIFLGWTTIIKGAWLALKWLSLEIYILADSLVKLATFDFKGIVDNFRSLTDWRREEQRKIAAEHEESYNLLMGIPVTPAVGPTRANAARLGFDVETPQLIKNKKIGPALIASEKAIANALLEIQKGTDKLFIELLENAYRLRLVKYEDYEARKFAAIDKGVKLEKEILDNEWDIINDQYEKDLKEAEGNEVEKIKKAREADRMRFAMKKADIDNRATLEKDNLAIQTEVRNIAISMTSMAHYYAVLDEYRNKDFESEKFTIEQRQALNKEQFNRNLISAKEYYENEMTLAKQSRDVIQQSLKDKFEDQRRKNLEEQAMPTIAGDPAKVKELKDKLIEIELKYNADVIAAERETVKILNDLWWNYAYNIEVLLSEKGILGVVRESLDQILREYELYGKRLKSATDTIAKGMADSFEGLFIDTMKLEFKSLGDYIQSFIGNIRNAFARFLADEVTKQLLAMFRGLLGSAGSASTTTLAGGQVIGASYGGGATTAWGMHRGGIVGNTSPSFTRSVPNWLFANAPRLHSGLRSDEYPAILQRGESVFPKGSSPNVEINIKNETGAEIAATPVVNFDIDKMVVGIILKNVSQNGPLRGLLKR